MDSACDITAIEPKIAKTPDLAEPHGSRRSIIWRYGSGDAVTNSDMWCRFEAAGWDRLSQPVARRIREQFPDDSVVYAIYGLEDVRRPGLPVCTYGKDNELAAVQHAKDLGDAVVVGVDRDGAVFGYHARSSVTGERLVEAANCSQPDTWRIAAALVELLELTSQEIRLSADAVASIRAGVGADESAIALYDWRDLGRPVASFPSSMREQALQRACERAFFPIDVEPDGTVVGLEASPGNGVYLEEGVYYEDVLEHLDRMSGGAPGADALAVVTAMLIASHYEEAWRITHKNWDDDRLVHGDIPERRILVDVRRRYAAARALEDSR